MRRVFTTFALVILLSVVLIALAVSDEVIKDPVCGMEVNPEEATCKIVGTSTLYFCNNACLEKFCAEPTAYLSQEELGALEILVDGAMNPEAVYCALEEVETASDEVSEPDTEAETIAEEVTVPETEAETIAEEITVPETEAETIAEEITVPETEAETIAEEVTEPEAEAVGEEVDE